ncbi:MAG: divalent metal cation transporter [Candidatus Paceibacterota bacterium]|jgi:NRAMP (natural resistance-associated macrophage protein)-like metal ion transporter
MKELIRRLKKSIGPGVITGIADDDPSGIATYAQTGAMFGLSQLWLALFSYPFMVAIQEMCGRIGMVTGTGLAGVIKKYYNRKILFSAIALLAITNIINIGADLGAMASAVQLVVPIPFIVALGILTLITTLSEVFIPYPKYVYFLKYLALTVLAYILAAFFVTQDWQKIFFATIIPHFEMSNIFILNITAMLGTTISPYLFFWQADEEVEEELVAGKIRAMGKGVPKITNNDVRQMRTDTAFGMFVSNLVTFFIIITVAGTLGANGVTEITSAAQVASSLEPLAGKFASLLFTLGIVGTGLLAVPVLAGSAAYAISEAFGWEEGLGKKFSHARAFYAVIIIATLVGLLVNLSTIDPIVMLYYAAILNGLLAPPLMILVLLIANNKKILGDKVNGKLGNILGVIITIIMSALTLYFLKSLL